MPICRGLGDIHCHEGGIGTNLQAKKAKRPFNKYNGAYKFQNNIQVHRKSKELNIFPFKNMRHPNLYIIMLTN